jgi:predicted NAD/FAD-binding protein
VIATHADTALGLLGDGATDDERRLLGAFRYSRNETVLHRDPSFLPAAIAARASWNVVADADPTRAAVTYDLSRLMGLDEQGSGDGDAPYLVTLNPRRAPASELHRVVFEHPQLDRAALDAQAELPRLAAIRGNRTYFAGAHLGFGFHEDAWQSGEAAAALIEPRA